MTTGAVLFSEMIPESNWEGEFNQWYDSEHIPLRMEVPGFHCVRRYRELDSLKYLAVYEMDHAEIMKSAEYKKVKENPSELTQWMLQSVGGFTRYIGEIISEQMNEQANNDPYDAPILYPVMFQVPQEGEQEFNDWYVEDHVPTLLKNPDWLACRRYRIINGEPGKWTHLALHYLANEEVLDCDERKEARNSPWRERLAQEEWFKGQYMLFNLIKKFNATQGSKA